MIKWYKKAVFENYANFDGRARRSEYWYFHLLSFILSLVFGFICGLINLASMYWLYSLAVLIPGIAVAIRRMHDVGKSGWYIFIPIYNFVLLCAEGDQGENEYGSDPKGFGDEIEAIGVE